MKRDPAAADLERQIDQARHDLCEMRDKEYKRLTREFANGGGYQQKYNTTLPVLLNALFGLDFVKRETDKSHNVKEKPMATTVRNRFSAANLPTRTAFS